MCIISLESKFYPLSEAGGFNFKTWSDSAYSTPDWGAPKTACKYHEISRPKSVPQCRDFFTQKENSKAYNPIYGWRAL